MFVGHYAAALAAKSVEPRAPLWAYVGAAQLLDIGWTSLVMANVEHVSFDTTLPGSPLVLYDMPWTHSLPAAVVWSVAALLVMRWALKLPWGAAVMVGLTVFSHWLLDYLVHRPDLLTGLGPVKVGLGWWNYPVPEQALEMGLIAITGAMWAGARTAAGRNAWPAVVFIAILVAVQIIGTVTAPAGSAFAFARTGLIVYVALTLIAVVIDLGKPKAAPPVAWSGPAEGEQVA
ncbi:MAG: hypothetical protein JWP35_4721 [Caulobacter sp.]|nr:hypothetical protein [Caulobacter sp.]